MPMDSFVVLLIDAMRAKPDACDAFLQQLCVQHYPMFQ